MEAEDRRDDQATEGTGDEHPHVRAASELSDRAAESVARRYDATKEIHHETQGSEDADEDDRG